MDKGPRIPWPRDNVDFLLDEDSIHRSGTRVSGVRDQGLEKPLARLVSCSSPGTKSPTSFEDKGFVIDVTKGLIWRPVADGCRESNAVPP
jgi:hypothetical protein